MAHFTRIDNRAMTMEAKLLSVDDAQGTEDPGEFANMDAISIVQWVWSNQKRLIELERAAAARAALDLAASDLESIKANDVYQRAFVKAAKRLRHRRDNFLPTC